MASSFGGVRGDKGRREREREREEGGDGWQGVEGRDSWVKKETKYFSSLHINVYISGTPQWPRLVVVCVQSDEHNGFFSQRSIFKDDKTISRGRGPRV